MAPTGPTYKHHFGFAFGPWAPNGGPTHKHVAHYISVFNVYCIAAALLKLLQEREWWKFRKHQKKRDPDNGVIMVFAAVEPLEDLCRPCGATAHSWPGQTADTILDKAFSDPVVRHSFVLISYRAEGKIAKDLPEQRVFMRESIKLSVNIGQVSLS